MLHSDDTKNKRRHHPLQSAQAHSAVHLFEPLRRRPLLLTTLVALLLATLQFLPYIIANEGVLTIVEDFNRQQIPFNMFSNQAIKDGRIFWNPEVDIGGSFFGMFSFYTLGSPFFWVSLLFPADFFPYLIGPLLMLKYVVAAIGAHLYMRRHVKNELFATLGALAYAFSGFQAINLIFNHFHDVVALFPFLMLSLDQLIEEDKRGRFAAMVGLVCLCNYFFAIAIGVFVILYLLIRHWIPNWDRQKKNLPKILLEGLLGIGISAVLLIPAAIWTSDLPRATRHLKIGNMFLHSNATRYYNLLRAVVFPADLMSRESVTYASYYTSMNAWLPGIGSSLALAYVMRRNRGKDTASASTKGNWLRRILIASVVFALIPLLNSTFYMFSSTYYARWFFMPVFFLALASAKFVDEWKTYRSSSFHALKKSVLALLALVLLLLVASLLLPVQEGKTAVLGIIRDPNAFLVMALVAILGLFATWWSMTKAPSIATALILIVSICGVYNGVHYQERAHALGGDADPKIAKEQILEMGLSFRRLVDEEKALDRREGREPEKSLLNLDEYRFDTPNQRHNVGMISNLSSINSFISTISPSVDRFYREMRKARFVFSVNDMPGIRSFLGAKYFVSSTPLPNHVPIRAHREEGKNAYVYELSSAMPIATTYDYYIPYARFQTLSAEQRSLIVHRAIPLMPQQVKDGYKELPAQEWARPLDERNLIRDDAKFQSLGPIQWDTRGFSIEIDLKESRLARIAIPADKGWALTVDGAPIELDQSLGMMLLQLPQGKYTLRGDYTPPGLLIGIAVTTLSLSLLVVYVLILRRMRLSKQRHRG